MSLPLLNVQELVETSVLCFLNNMNVHGNISTALAVKLLNTSAATVAKNVAFHSHLLKRHLVPIILCLCELLDECTTFWDGLAPVHSLSDMDELREMVLDAVDMQIKLCCDVLVLHPSFAIGVEWLWKTVTSLFGNYQVMIFKIILFTLLVIAINSKLVMLRPVSKITSN